MENFYTLICDGTFSLKRVKGTFLHTPNSQRSVWPDEIKPKYSLRGTENLECKCF